ncbi:hypothetical protein CDL15_Pgr024861 [Punica granatum]|uniref:DNA replication ATP-dependent helicase/nuclease n=1 Tax=Punica granatum TaxID=22663 RepID=A0A218Y2K3_PUNGR|nr:hypothetical protein CDL15_Pgr024861 [Punica granatum]
MPPRKRSTSSSSSAKKSNHQNQSPQPSKYGIQHFFDRHSQQNSSQNLRSDSGDSRSTAARNVPGNEQNPISGGGRVVPVDASASTASTSKPGCLQDTLPEDNVMGKCGDGGESPIEVSPEISKSVPLKRFKFSPGMLIKQSQDDGGDEVTWKISPVNERLQAVSKKMPEMIKVLAESSKLNSLYIRQCSQVKSAPGPTGKVERWLSSPTRNAPLICANKMGVKRVNSCWNPDSKGRTTELISSCFASLQSPFQTPSSCQHKALLELLDQVEDAISIEGSGTSIMEACLAKDEDQECFTMPRETGRNVQVVADIPKAANGSSLDRIFLVLEVAEKRGTADSLTADCPYKVLWLLNEKTGEEKVVCLWDEWFYSIISPGDTVNVIGRFDDHGKCNVNRGNNLLIVHPDLLVSGTRVAASFGCPRRSVLDERLKCNDYSTAAIVGTMLHQIFQCSKASEVDFGLDDGTKKIKISEVIDIEEMSWAPNYGLKGMIDASIRSSMEHTAQVILYTLLMSERYLKPIDSGLLYYLQSEHTQGIAVRRSDLVGLIMRRNELANDILKALTAQQLPPMLQSPSKCKGCRHLNVCTIYHKAHGGGMETSGLSHLFDACTNHLTADHYDFLKHWDRLIDLEAKDAELGRKKIWRSRNTRHNHLTSSLSPIVLDTVELPNSKHIKDGRFHYRFVRQDLPLDKIEACPKDNITSAAANLSSNDSACTLRKGDLVILTTESDCQAIASGVISEISGSHISVSFSKRLRLPQRLSSASNLIHEVWRIDKDEIMTSFAVMRFNLIQLFLENAWSSHLRRMIVDLEAPRFDSGCIFSQDPAISYVWSEGNLNDDQRRAILKILTARDYALILGMPGTGKTSTMVHAVKALLIRGASILLTSYTNSAVDNLLIKLKDQVALGPLMLASTFVLVGDHYQLPPLVKSMEAQENGLGISLFCRLSEAHPQAISALQSQYRMCQGIMQLANALIYGDRLQCGSSDVANAKLKFSMVKPSKFWLKEVLDPTRPVVFMNTDLLPALEEKDHKAVNNPIEASIIAEVTGELVNNGIMGEEIGIITPYNSQANLIQAAVTSSVEIHTIDKYQGRDKDCILVSFVRSCEKMKHRNSSILEDWHRINVALTRAKKKLIMVGSCRTLSKWPLLKLLMEKVDEQSGLLNLSREDLGITTTNTSSSRLREPAGS